MFVKLHYPPTLGSVNEMISQRKAVYITTEAGETLMFKPDLDLQPLAFDGQGDYLINGTVVDSVTGQEQRAVLKLVAFSYRGTRKASVTIIND